MQFDFDDSPPEGEQLPPTLVKSLAIPNFGRAWIAKNKPYNGDQLVSGMALITTGAGEDTRVDGFTSFVMGPTFDVAISLAHIFPSLTFPSQQSALMSWSEKPCDIPFNTNTWLTPWREGMPDIDRGDIFLSTEGKAVLAKGRASTTKEKEHDSEMPANVPIEFSYRYVLAAVSGSRAKLGLQIIPCGLDRINAIAFKDSTAMGGFMHWIKKDVEWYPTLHPKYNLQGPAAYLAPLNPSDDQNDVGSLPSENYREEVYNSIMEAKCPLEMPASAALDYTLTLARRCPTVQPTVESVTETGPPNKKQKVTNTVFDGTPQQMSPEDLAAIRDKSNQYMEQQDSFRLNRGNGASPDATDTSGLEALQRLLAFTGGSNAGNLSLASLKLPEATLKAMMPFGIDTKTGSGLNVQDILGLHGLEKTVGKDFADKSSYASATELREIPAHDDDRSSIIHPARCLPLPLVPPEKYWSQVNRKVKDKCTLLYIEHFGIAYSVPRVAIENLLDSGNKVKIKWFSKENVDVLQLPVLRTDIQVDGQTGSQSSLPWKNIERMYSFVDALHNYSDVMFQLHPINYGPRVILRGFHRWRYLAYPAMKGTKTQLRACISVVNSAMSANADRARLDKPPLSAREFDSLLTDTLRDGIFPFCRMPESQIDPYEMVVPSTTTADTDTDGTVPNQLRVLRQQMQLLSKQAGTPSTASKKTAPRTSPTLSNGSQICNQFNQAAGCRRAPKASSCTLTNGIVLAHACNFRMKSGGVCGQPHAKVGNH